MLAGPASARLYDMMLRHMKVACDNYAGLSVNLLRYSAGDMYEASKALVCQKMLRELPGLLVHVTDYADEALDLAETLRAKMAELPPDEFEALLHPVFEEDEWKLIVMGGALGLIIGVIQMYTIG